MANKGTIKNRYQSIVTIDPDSLKSYSFQENDIKLNKLSGFKKDNFYISIISSKNLIMDFIEVSRNVSEEDLDGAIEIQVYDELNFDPSIQYTIFYKEFFGSEDSEKRKFNVFAVETDKVEAEFEEVINRNKYIDYIIPEPLVIKSLYDKNFLEKDSVDCFIYFKKRDAFLAIYADGEYLYSKSIGFSLDKMHEKFCEITGENIQYDDFVYFILNGASNNISKENQKLILKLYREIFVYINDVIFYAKRAYHVEEINRIYVNSSIGLFKHIDRYIRTYIDIEPHELNIKIAKNTNALHIEQLHNMMILTALEYIEEPDDSLNFSIFKRPPSFGKRPVGKLILVALVSLIISLIYPAYEFGYSYFLKYKLNSLKTLEHKLYIEATTIQNKLAILNKKQKSVQSKLAKEDNKLNFKKTLLEEIYNKKIHYPMKVSALVRIFQEINAHHCKIYNVKITTDKKLVIMVFSVFSRKDKNVTELIKELTKIKKYDISTKEIKKDPKKSIYLSDIKVVIHDGIQ